MEPYFELTRCVRKNIGVTKTLLAKVITGSLQDSQVGALMACLDADPAFVSDVDDEATVAHILEHQLSKFSVEKRRAATVLYGESVSAPFDWVEFARAVASSSLDDFVLGYWLMRVTLGDLPATNVDMLTRAMSKSGETFDYRPAFASDKFLRRYPTGALSEKVALMMPTVLCAMRTTMGLRLRSPYLVARVLGHTGGTRDKLNAIRGFKMPPPGDPTLAILAKTGVCYTVTQNSFNPADDRMYSLRSETDTIESLPLIVSSIASKMLACPVDLMQIDVRHGPGAFFPTVDAAQVAGATIARACTTETMVCFATVTDAGFPTGSSVGSVAEVAEAIVALGGGSSTLFDPRGIDVQRCIVAEFTARLVADLFSLSLSDVYIWIHARFVDGSFGKAFNEVLRSHGVSADVVDEIWQKPESLLEGAYIQEIHSTQAGRLTAIDQREIGRRINSAGHSFSLILKARLGDRVDVGQCLARIYRLPGADAEIAIGPEQFVVN